MHVNHMLVQYLESTMDHSLSKVELWSIQKKSYNQPIWAQNCTNSVWLAITKVVPNYTFFLHDFFWIFSQFLVIFT
jgi:hypothetical protein